MERLSFVTEYLQGPLDEGSLNTAFHLTQALSAKVKILKIYVQHSTDSGKNQYSYLPKNKLFLNLNFLMQFKQFAPDVVIYLPAASGTVGGFLRGYILKMFSGPAKIALIYLQPRPLSSTVRLLARVSAVDIVFTQSCQSAYSLNKVGFNTCWIPGGVDSSKFIPVGTARKRELRKKYNLPEYAKIILHIGHLNRGRNIQELVKLCSNGYSVVLVTSNRFQSDIDLRDSILQSGGTIISDFIENIEEVYQLADVYVFPTTQVTSAIETPLSVFEAMSCNLPVVTTRFGSLPDIFHDGNGFFFYDHHSELSGLIESALNNVEKCKTRSMVQPYTWDKVVNQILARLETQNTINEHGKRARTVGRKKNEDTTG